VVGLDRRNGRSTSPVPVKKLKKLVIGTYLGRPGRPRPTFQKFSKSSVGACLLGLDILKHRARHWFAHALKKHVRMRTVV